MEEFYQLQFSERTASTYLEFRCSKKGGETIWVGQSVNLQEMSGWVTGFQGVVRDITERKEAQMAMQDSEARYRELFETASDLIHSIDSAGNILYANRSWHRTLGYTTVEVNALNFFDLIPEEDRSRHRQQFNKLITIGSKPRKRITYDLLGRDGQRITVEGSTVVSRNLL